MSFRSTPKILVAVVAFALMLVCVGAVASYYKPADAPPPTRAELEQAARAEVARNQEAGRRAKEEAAKQKAATPKTSGNPFETDSGRALMLGLFIKPALKQMLNDPDSLQDLEISSVNRLKGKPTTFRVAVFYRARNAFGALVGAQQAFAVVENEDAGDHALDAWIVLPVKK
jgi:hypothetical protein